MRVIGFSLSGEELMGEMMRRAGAVGYVVKGSDSDVLLSAIRTAAHAPSQPVSA